MSTCVDIQNRRRLSETCAGRFCGGTPRGAVSNASHCFSRLEDAEGLAVARQWGGVAFTRRDGGIRELVLPLLRGVLALAAVRGDARAHTADDRRVDRRPGDDRLPLRERGEVIEQVASDAFD